MTLLPVTVTAFGFQITLGRLLGDSTDEGLDARTSYQFLAAFFGSLLAWPVVAAGWLALAVHQHDVMAAQLGFEWLNVFGEHQIGQFTAAAAFYLVCFPVFWISGMSFAWGWDAWVDLRKAGARRRLRRHMGERLSALLERC